MKDIEGKSYPEKGYTSLTAQKRKRRAADHVRSRRTSRRKAKAKLRLE